MPEKSPKLNPTEKSAIDNSPVDAIKDSDIAGWTSKSGPTSSYKSGLLDKVSGAFGRVRDASREVLGKAREITINTPIGDFLSFVEHTGIRFGDLKKVSRFERGYQKEIAKGKGIEAAQNTAKKSAEDFGKSIDDLDTRLKSLSEKGLASSSVLSKASREREGLSKRKNAAEQTFNKSGEELKRQIEKINLVEGRLKSISEKGAVNIRERSAPYLERVKNLTEKKNILAEKEKRIRARYTEAQKQYLEYEKGRAGSKFGFERKAFNDAMKESARDLKKIENNLKASEYERSLNDRKLDKANERLGKWTQLENEFTKVGSGKKSARTGTSTGTAPDTTPSTPEKKDAFEAKRISLEKYLEEWNKLFKDLPVPPELLVGLYKNPSSKTIKKEDIDVKKEISGTKIEEYIRGFYAEYSRTTKKGPDKKVVEENLAKMREIFMK